MHPTSDAMAPDQVSTPNAPVPVDVGTCGTNGWGMSSVGHGVVSSFGEAPYSNVNSYNFVCGNMHQCDWNLSLHFWLSAHKEGAGQAEHLRAHA